MKTPKPGQFVSYNGIVYRAVKRTFRCNGCVLDDILLCPNIVDKRFEQQKIDCEKYDIVLTTI